MKTVASVLAENLKEMGVTHAFGVPGKPVVPLILALEEKGIRFVLSRHESGGGYEATGYALKKNGLGVAIGTSGPGGTNLLTSVGQAKAYHAPVLFLTGQPPIKSVGQAQGQESTFFGTDLVRIYESVARFSARVARPELFKPFLSHAIEKAYQDVKGPVHLSIPLDVLTEEIEPFHLFQPKKIEMAASNIEEVVQELNQSEHPIMMLGKGVDSSKAYEEVRRLAEFWNIPVITTPGGKGTFPSNHPLSLGPFGLGGTQEANQYLKSGVDLMIVIGSKLSDMSVAGLSEQMYPKKLIHFDYDPTFIGKTLPIPTIFVPGDAKTNIQQVLNSSEKVKRESKFTKEAFISEHKTTKEKNDIQTMDRRISAAETMKILRKLLPDHTTIFGDDGSHTFYAIQNFDIYQPGTFFFDDVFGAMGHAIGLSVGAKLAAPDEHIVCITGDGSLFMQGAEVSTAVNQKANVIFVVLNNGRLDMVEKGMKYHVGQTTGTIYDTEINARDYARSMGAEAFRCFTGEEIEQAVKFALNHDSVTVIEVMVDPDEIPPTMMRG